MLSDELHPGCFQSKHRQENFLDKVAIFHSTLEYGTERKIHISSIVYSAFQFISLSYFISVTVLPYSAKYFRGAVSGKTKKIKCVS